MTKLINAREAAYLAVLASLRDEKFAVDYLNIWKNQFNPSTKDFHLAQEIAYGALRMALALDFIAAHLTVQKKLNLKLKEKALLRTAVYQKVFMDRIPLYAIADETVIIAKKHCHSSFVSFLNAILRKLETHTPELPQKDTPEDLSIHYSYPKFFVELLLSQHPLTQVKDILEAGNTPSKTIVRIRNADTPIPKELKIFTSNPARTAILEESHQLNLITSSQDYYIQNVTPATLIAELAEQSKKSHQSILDLCAAPGGKILAAHDHFPKASLFANDISEDKIALLKSNFEKYDISVTLSCSRGQEFQSDKKFDLIILDVPCSNSGVLNKRAEARWRITPEALKDLEYIQLELIKNSQKHLSEAGQIWYMTCSILGAENENLVKKACEQFNLKLGYQKTILPNMEGWDGGFAAILK